MHKLVDYINDELDELERKADNDGKLSMAEIQYIDTLAHAKKNLLKGEEGGVSHDGYNRSMARKRDSMGRYSSYAVDDMVESIYSMMDDLPEGTRRDAQRFIKKLESARR